MASSTLATNLTPAKTEQKPQQTPTKSATSGLSQQQSPRNTSNAISGTYVQWGPVEVSKALQDGEKFVRWDEVSFS